MKIFLQELLTFALFVASIVCFYLSLTAFFASILLNIISFFTGVFLLIQAAGFVDRIKGFGPSANSNSNSNTTNNTHLNNEIMSPDATDEPMADN